MSLNNSNKYNGTTYLEQNSNGVLNPHIHRIRLDDGTWDALYEVEFTDEQLQSHDQFFKGVSKSIYGKFFFKVSLNVL